MDNRKVVYWFHRLSSASAQPELARCLGDKGRQRHPVG
jgi:hypothetical protein